MTSSNIFSVKFIYILLLFTFTNLAAQKYNTVGGVRIGDDFGISFSQRFANKNTFELIHQPGTYAGKELTSLVVKQHYSLLTKRLNFFMGAGVYSGKFAPSRIDNVDVTRSTGMALNFGAEVSIGRLSISTDYLPLVTLNRNNSNQRFYTTSGMSLRYILVPRKSGTTKFFQKIFKKDK